MINQEVLDIPNVDFVVKTLYDTVNQSFQEIRGTFCFYCKSVA